LSRKDFRCWPFSDTAQCSPLCEQKRTLSLACLIDPVPTPMMVFPIGVEHTLDVTVERPHNADARKHCRPIVFRDQDQGFHGCLPLWCLVLGFRKLRDVGPSILQRDELVTAGDGDWTPTFVQAYSSTLCQSGRTIRTTSAASQGQHVSSWPAPRMLSASWLGGRRPLAPSLAISIAFAIAFRSACLWVVTILR